MPFKRRARAVAVGAILVLIVAASSVDYTVEPGDTLGRIAKEHGVSVSSLAEANNIADPNLIHIGQVLVIPGKEGEPEEIHVVVRGDTLRRIAAAYGTSVSALSEANKIANPNLIQIGQKILVTGGGGSGSSSSSGSGSTASAARSGKFHVIKPGESLNFIAGLYQGVSASQLAQANGITNGVIWRGSRLFLDGPSYIPPTGGTGETVYTVQPGDRLGEIAARHGTTVSAIANRNGISNVNLIRSGQKLEISGGSTWYCPVKGAVFHNDWGVSKGNGRYHDGNDMRAKRGTPVLAPVSGTVVQKQGSIGGFQVSLSGDDGLFYLMSHLDSFGASGNVGAGDVVGTVGNTGNASGTRPHLHFGMHYKGVWINPYPSLVGNCG